MIIDLLHVSRPISARQHGRPPRKCSLHSARTIRAFHKRRDMNVLENKVAVVTGASSGIGRATALLFASEGAAVVVGARRKPELDALVNEISSNGGRAISVAGDVRDEHYAQTLVQTAVENFGGLDIAFNNAG